jgi:hypothetical protein
MATLLALSLCLGYAPRARAKKAAPLTADEVRALLIEADDALERYTGELMLRVNNDTPSTLCYGRMLAKKWGRLSEVRAVVSKYATGPALQCYLASYFGCTIDEWVWRSGIAEDGVEFLPYEGSAVAIIEQTPDRVVADVFEASRYSLNSRHQVSREIHPDGILPEVKTKSRYTLTRDATGRWRIFDRKPNFEWECRVR